MRFDGIVRYSSVGAKEQFSADIVKPRYLKVFTFSEDIVYIQFRVDQLISSIKIHNFSFVDVNI